MQKKSCSRSALSNARGLGALVLFAVAGCLVASGTSLPFLRSEIQGIVSHRVLAFAERVAYQRAIEQVYWQHRIWPKENPQRKPPLDAIVSQAQLEQKVEEYFRKSQFVADQRGSPISASELQAQMEQMASHTLHPRVLLELFQALGNDPFVIAECLARPLVAERLASELTGQGGVEALVPNSKMLTAASASTSQSYKLPQISVPLDCIDGTWTATTTVNAPDARRFHTAVWTGSEMIIWGGFNDLPPYFFNTGGRYSPATDSWTATNTTNAPSARDFQTAVWTGTEMIIWGGGGNELINTGARYDPTTDSWTPTSTTNAPAPRVAHTAVWSGTDMIVWGGRNNAVWMNSGGRFNPSTDSWTATGTINAPEARWAHTVEWTGSEMIVWGGTNQTIYLNTGAKYNPTDNSWTPTTTANAPLGRVGHTAIWSGSEMMVWGGTDSTFNDTNTGGRYNRATDSWSATSVVNAPSPRDSLAAVWTGSEMIVWGGVFCCPAIDFDTGGRYNAGTDSWTATSTDNAPVARFNHTAVWTGTEMIAWGGFNYELQIYLNTGGRYCAPTGPTPTPTPSATSTATATPTATATSTPRATPTPRIAPTPRLRPTPRPRP